MTDFAAYRLATIRIVLVEPQGPLNLGAVTRVMKNMGLSHLTLVNPQCDSKSEEARRMAVHAKDLLNQAHIEPTLEAAIADCQRVIATTGRSTILNASLESPRQALPWLISTTGDANQTDRNQSSQSAVTSAVIFGREDSGLSNEELNLAHRFVRIPVSSAYESMNLAQAVGICVYELRQAALAQSSITTPPDTRPASPPPSLTEPVEESLASAELLEKYYSHLEETLLSIQVLYPHTAAAKMAKLRRIYQRAQLRPEEVGLLRGILGQVDWYAQQNLSQTSQTIPYQSDNQ